MGDGDINVAALFNTCDVDSSGYIEKEELQLLVPHVGTAQLDELLQILDTDGDGKISRAELANSLQQLQRPPTEITITKSSSDSGLGEDNSAPR